MKRTALKWLHWLAFLLMLYFLLVQPDDLHGTASAKTAALANHAGMGFLLAIIITIWTLEYWRSASLRRPGPEPSPQLKRLHH